MRPPEDIKSNPILYPPENWFGAPAFDLIQLKHFLPAIRHGIAAGKAEIEAIRNNPAPPTFENTIEALEFSGKDFLRASSLLRILGSVKSTAKMQALQKKASVLESAYNDDMMQDPALFARIAAVYDRRDKLPLNGAQRMLLERTYKGFVDNGARLEDGEDDTQGKKRLRKLNERIGELGLVFSQNVQNYQQSYQKFITDENDLRGVPDRTRQEWAEAAKLAGHPGEFLIQLSPPPEEIFMHCENRELRREIWHADMAAGNTKEFDNRPVIRELVQLSHERAQLLGYKNAAAYDLSDCIMKTPEDVARFLDSCAESYRGPYETYIQQLRDFARRTDGITQLEPWDQGYGGIYGYYDVKMKEALYNISSEDLRPYFELGRVVQGLHRHLEKLLGVTIRDATEDYPADPDYPGARVYEVSARDGEIKGLLYTNLYAGKNKEEGAWADTIRDRGIENGEDRIPIATVCCNFPRPVPGQPTLLDPVLEVAETLWHEYGHAFNALLAEGPYASQNGFNVANDFVELASQLMENWARQKEVIETYAFHHETGEKLPMELLDKALASLDFGGSAMGYYRTFQARLDMAWYNDVSAPHRSIEEIEYPLLREMGLPDFRGEVRSSWLTHIFGGGYQSTLYGYKFSQMLDAQVFEPFRKKGLYDPELAANLLPLYSKGGNVEPMELFVGLTGAKPDPSAMFRREGVAAPEENKGENKGVRKSRDSRLKP